jgi:hypothetical protein
MNTMLKRKTDYKRYELPVFIEKVRELVKKHNREVERSVIGRGKYRLREQYHSSEVPESKWFVMNLKQREKHLSQVHSTQVFEANHDCLQSDDLASSPSAATGCTVPEQASSTQSILSVDLEKAAQHVTVPFKCLEGIWDKAIQPINSTNAMVNGPG